MKRLASLLLSLTAALWCCVPASAQASSAWAELYLSDAEHVYEIIPEELEGCDWRQPITRQEFCFLLYDTLRCIRDQDAAYRGTEAEPLSGDSPFADTKDPRIGALYTAGVAQGTGGSHFSPEGFLTRQEAAAFLSRAAEFCGLQTFTCDLTFLDAQAIAPWAAQAVDHVCGMGLMNGTGGGLFAPAERYTREQAVATAIRLIASYPYLNNRTDLGEGLTYRFNQMRHWVEDGDGNVILDLPAVWHTYDYRTDYGCESLQFFRREGQLLCAVRGFDRRSEPARSGTRFLDVLSGGTVADLPWEAGYVYGLTEEGYILTQETRYGFNNVDSACTLWGVYDLNGNALIPLGAAREELERFGYLK